MDLSHQGDCREELSLGYYLVLIEYSERRTVYLYVPDGWDVMLREVVKNFG